MATRSLGLAFVAPPLLLVPLLYRGGLAPVVVAAGFALLVGAPAAVAIWRTPVGPGPSLLGAARTSVAELAGLLLVSAGLAALAADAGSPGLLLAVAVWPAVALLGRLPQGSVLLAVLAATGLVGTALVAVVLTPPWTLLEPHWDAWRTYLGPAATAGVLLGGAGTGYWTLGPRRPPGDRHAPWAVVGLGLLVTTALALELGARFEQTLGVPGTGWSALVLVALGLVPASASLVSATPLWPRLLVGLAGTLLFAGPAAGIAGTIGSSVVPALASLLLAETARRASGPDRLFATLAAVVLAGGAAVAWPGVPERTADAVWLALVAVGVFWFVATRALLARSTP